VFSFVEVPDEADDIKEEVDLAGFLAPEGSRT